MDIVFEDTLFNPLYFHLLKYMRDYDIRSILSYGGSSAAKTHSYIQAITLDGYKRGYNTACFRKEQSSVKDTIKNDFNDIVGNIIEIPGLDDMFMIQEFKIIMDNGNFIRLRGLDKPDKIKGIKGFRKLYFDELDQFDYKDWEEAQRRLRGEDNQQLLASWNPISEKHWIKKELIDSDEWEDLPKMVNDNPFSLLSDKSWIRINKRKNTILIKCNYLDNKWVVGGEIDGVKYGRLDRHVVDHFEHLKVSNYNAYLVYGEGEWGAIKNDSPFFYNYKPSVHETNEILKPFYNQQCILTWDFNVEGCTCELQQLVDRSSSHDRLGKYVYETFEADNDDHKGATEKVCDKILRSGLIQNLKKAGTFGLLRITGDVNGNNRSTKSNNTDYQIIRKKLGLSKNHFHVGGKNLGLSASQDLSNEVLYHIPVTIVKPMNAELCHDLLEGEVDLKSDGSFKGIKKDRKQGHKQDKGDAYRYGDDFYFPGGYDTKGTTRMTVVKWMNKNGLN